MLRRISEALARRKHPADPNPASEVRTPDPYVWRLPNRPPPPDTERAYASQELE